MKTPFVVAARNKKQKKKKANGVDLWLNLADSFNKTSNIEKGDGFFIEE